jgi:carbamoyl-phosphate synthase small subunit
MDQTLDTRTYSQQIFELCNHQITACRTAFWGCRKRLSRLIFLGLKTLLTPLGNGNEVKLIEKIAKLALEDGTVYQGTSIGADGEIDGEVVFNTSMTGYQEILTDPSYRGQIVTMTYPMIGNYGVNADDVESRAPQVSGFIVREASRIESNYRSNGSLRDYLQRNQIKALAGIDTRALVRKIRISGAMRGVISTTDLDNDSLIRKAKASPGLVGRDLVREVVPKESQTWNEQLHSLAKANAIGNPALADSAPRIVCLDFGMKWNIARHLAERGNDVKVLPGTATAEQVMAEDPDGIFLSNGPGDPEPLTYAIGTIRELLGKRPIFGICLGHQLLSLASGAKTFKLKFGHRGANQPVLNIESGRVEITSQNHGFAVDEASLPACLAITHRNLNDNTIAGVRHREVPAFSVQYHPEASAGPHDSSYLFDQFQQSLSHLPSTVEQPTS